MPLGLRRASKLGVAAVDQAGMDGAGAGWARDWEAVRGAADIQYAPVAPPPPPQTPEWLKRLGEWLEAIFGPLGRWLGMSWPVFEKVLLAAAVIVLAWLVGVLVRRWLASRRPRGAPAEPEWTPGRAEALALLEDADRLAAAGDYGAAVHLLLLRSVGQIAAARPKWIEPASTAREIAALERLPEKARSAFGLIASLVERSRFALRALAGDDWQAARGAYAEFALARLGPEPA